MNAQDAEGLEPIAPDDPSLAPVDDEPNAGAHRLKAVAAVALVFAIAAFAVVKIHSQSSTASIFAPTTVPVALADAQDAATKAKAAAASAQKAAASANRSANRSEAAESSTPPSASAASAAQP